MNYIPDKSVENGSYLCTWHRQGYVAKKYGITGNHGADVRDAMTAEYLFGCEDNYHYLPMEYRKGLYFLLDDGWDFPTGYESVGRIKPAGSMEPDPVKFASLGTTPLERLKKLNDLAKEFGYVGLGLWVSPQMPMENEVPSLEVSAQYWKEKAIQSREAGVKYWKVDWGKHSTDIEYRRMMTRVLKENAPDISIEHAFVQSPLTDEEEKPRRKQMSREILAISDYFRTYDVMWPMQDSAVISRVHDVLSDPLPFELGVKGMINAEYQYLIAAGLGFQLGAMDPQIEISAVLRWQRICPPFSVKDTNYVFSKEMVTDNYFYARDICWIKNGGTTVTETAPAVIARGCKLPEVYTDTCEKPYVLASKNPHYGAYAISILRRNIEQNAHVIIPADVKMEIDDVQAFVGIFGNYRSLTLIYPDRVPDDVCVYAQNLMDDAAIDITSKVQINANRIYLPGRLISQIGSCNYTYSNDLKSKISDPMMLIKVEQK
ncbi:MAG: hypothetical protein MJ236_03395 [Clostridia bacterium]|nr:hypothetical protein [Clostridia bacterium]